MMTFPRIVPSMVFNPLHKQHLAKEMEGRA